jgi:uncharacterized pyridoxal phosphate-containing UPF0001 family protein
MGMSSDWREALAAGSDWLRIGTALFSAPAQDSLGSIPGGRP